MNKLFIILLSSIVFSSTALCMENTSQPTDNDKLRVVDIKIIADDAIIFCKDENAINSSFFHLNAHDLKTLNSPVINAMLKKEWNSTPREETTRLWLPEIESSIFNQVLNVPTHSQGLIHTLIAADSHMSNLIDKQCIARLHGYQSPEYAALEKKVINPLENNSEINAKKIDAAVDFLGLTLPDFSNNFANTILRAVGDKIEIPCTEYCNLEGSSVTCFAVDSDVVVTGFSDGSLKIVDRNNGKTLKQLSLGSKDSNAIALSSKYICVGTEGKVIKIIDKKTYHCVTEFNFLASALVVKDNTLISGGDEGIVVWDLDTMKRTVSMKVKDVCCLALHNNAVYSGGIDRFIRKWDIASGECTGVLDCGVNWTLSLAVDNDSIFARMRKRYLFESEDRCFLFSQQIGVACGNDLQSSNTNTPRASQIIDNLLLESSPVSEQLFIFQKNNLKKPLKTIKTGIVIKDSQLVDTNKIAVFVDDNNSVKIYDLSAFLAWNNYITKELSFAHRYVLSILDKVAELNKPAEIHMKLAISEWQLAVIQDMYTTVKNKWGLEQANILENILQMHCILKPGYSFKDN